MVSPTMSDGELIADAKKKVSIHVGDGEELDALIKEAGVPSQDTIQKLKPLLEN